jgi:hypothetical protein
MRTASRSQVSATIAALALWGLMNGSVHAVPVLDSDSFVYSGTALAGQNGGSGWSGAWFTTAGSGANTLSNDSTSLSYPATFESPAVAPATAGARVKTTSPSTNANTSRLLSSTIPLNVDGTVAYASALFRKNVANGSTANDNVLIEFVDSSANRRWGFGIEGAGDKPWLNANGSTTPSAGPAVTVGDTYLIVTKIVSSASGLDTAFLKVYGTGYGSQVSFAEPTTWDATLTESTGAILDRVRLRIDSANTLAGEIDELRIGNSWSAVTAAVPECTPLVLLLGGGIACVVRRKFAR